MPRTLPPLNPLRAFEAAGRLGSFTAAAEELGVSHSAISRHVRGLEKRLNVHLFRTRKTGVELTEQGREYLPQIIEAFDQIALATEALAVPAKGVVTLTTENTVAQQWLVPRLANLRAAHPDIDLRLSISTDVMDIEAHDFDLGLRYLRSDTAEDHDKIFPCTVEAFASPRLIESLGGLDGFRSIPADLLIEEATFRLWGEWFESCGLDMPKRKNPPHPLNALLTIQSAVAGLGFILQDEHLCEPEIRAGTLVRLADVQFPYGGYYLAVNERAGRRKAVRAVRQWLIMEGQKPVARQMETPRLPTA